MFNLQCRMPNDNGQCQCPMPDAQCKMPDAKCWMPNGWAWHCAPCQRMHKYACVNAHTNESEIVRMPTYAHVHMQMHGYSCVCKHTHVRTRMHRYAYASRGRRMYAYACICVRMHEHARMETDALPCIHTHAYVMHARSCTQGHGCIDMNLHPYAGVCMPMHAHACVCTDMHAWKRMH